MRSTTFDPNLITCPAHYAEGRTLFPIDVIERWGLCHHLACVVKYLARAGRKNPILEDLKKAEWYLARELDPEKKSQDCPVFPLRPQPFTTEAVVEDWQLPFHLGETLFHIKASKSPALRHESLTNALKHLKAEILHYKQATPLKGIHL